MPPPKAKVLSAGDIRVGLEVSFQTDVGEQHILQFAKLSGDHNPLHIDETYAAATNFRGRIAHGAYQFGLASAMAGMHIPGQYSLLTTVDCKFLAPLYYPARVRINGRVTAWNGEAGNGILAVDITNTKDDSRVSEFIIRFSLHDHASAPATKAPKASAAVEFESKASEQVILITGASGGVGQYLTTALKEQYSIIALSRHGAGDDMVAADLEDEGWKSAVADRLAGRALYAVVHAAWPGMPRGGLLKGSCDVVDRQVRFGIKTTLGLANSLMEFAPKSGGRLIAIGSTVGSHNPNPAVAAYSLGKAALENTVRLAAPELAAKKILANVVAPGLLPIGINKQMSARQQQLEQALVPLARLCAAEDLCGTVRFLLSEQSAFMSGQVLKLTGGQI